MVKLAAKNITMKNHNGTGWDELYPKTIAEQVIETSAKRFTSDTELANKAEKSNATTTADGLMSKEDKTKLNSIASGANNYSHPPTHPATMITGLSTVATTGSYTDLQNKPILGTAADKNTGIANGNVPLIGADGKLDAAIMPAIAITDTFVVSTQAAMLALDVQVGDVSVRTDINKSFILKAEPASTLTNWQELLTPSSPVQSVAGKTGAVTLTKSDVGLSNVDNTSDASKPISTATQTALNAKAPIASPAFTGSPTAPTQTAADNSTKIATTAFVKTAVQAVSSSMPTITVSPTTPSNPMAGDFWYEIV